MSRSHKSRQKGACSSARSSDRTFKTLAHRAMRRAFSDALAKGREPPVRMESVSNLFDSQKCD